MGIEGLRGMLGDAPAYRELAGGLRRGERRMGAVMPGSAVAFALAALGRGLRGPALVVVPRPEDARGLCEQIAAWSGSEGAALHFPESEILPFERLDSDADTLHQRLRTLAALSAYGDGGAGCGAGAGAGADGYGGAPLVVASAAALMQRTVARPAFAAGSGELRRGQRIDLNETLDLWRRLGYRFESAVYGPGFVSRRGGIIDIFPADAELPARIELWGNEIDSIRLFDPADQRSGAVVDSVYVPPAHEILPAFADFQELERVAAGVDMSNCEPKVRRRISEELEALLEGNEVEEQGFYAGFFNRGGLLDYFLPAAGGGGDDGGGGGSGLLVLHRYGEIAAAAREMELRAEQLRATKEGRGELPRNFPSSHLGWDEIEARFAGFGQRLDVGPPRQEGSAGEDGDGVGGVADGDGDGGGYIGDGDGGGGDAGGVGDSGGDDGAIVLPFTPAARYYGSLDRFVQDAWELAEGGAAVVAITSHARRLSEIFADAGLGALAADGLEGRPERGRVTIAQSAAGGVGAGFGLSLCGGDLAVFSDAEIFGAAKQRRTRRRAASGARAALLAELSPGDYVVHVEHGVGRFMGTARGVKGDAGNGDDREYMRIDYANDDKLYVPLEHLDRVSPYVSPKGQPKALTRLGTQQWRLVKRRAERSTREMAAELLTLYAERELARGHAFVPDARWQSELEESFPFEETLDQSRAIDEVKADMESGRPMDRLVCGDVGYGKTEIALRAAFKAVMDGKQVAVLAPTTVLAQQHYATFSERLSAFPTRVDVLSRFRTDEEQRSVVKRIGEGDIDICVGTHRLLQDDVRFKDLGLVIVDEEQRFGVNHKEGMKRMRQEVDILTLTATPIPRSLHMALSGARDLSTMDTPPEERLPIKTYVSEYSEALIREAVLREIDRQGQVYFLHNRVHNIESVAARLRRLVPEARVGVAHGQMAEGELEEAMLEFAAGRVDMLVCTTIIESGLDIPRVNTLVIDRADRLGLSQLYQLRGRVGRSARRAYCYLLTPPGVQVAEAAEKRLRAMLEATELGSGFRIAMKDLEIRGAGNILGAEQSGNMHAVGFDLYARLLANAVEELRARGVAGDGVADGDGADGGGAGGKGASGGARRSPLDAPEPLPLVELGLPASLPEDYISDLGARLGMYRRVVTLEGADGAADIEDELRDRFGPLPWEAQNLLYAARLKLQARRAGVQSITRDNDKDRVTLRFASAIGGARNALRRVLGRDADVGNTLVHLPMGTLESGGGGDWELGLAAAVDRLAEFTERALAAAGG